MHLDRHTQEEQTARTEINLPTALVIPYLWGEVDIGSSVEQQLSYVQVFIVCSNVEGCEASLQGHIMVSTCHSNYLCILEKKTPNTNVQLLYIYCSCVQSHLEAATQTCIPC